MATKVKRRYEPDRRERLIDVGLDVIAQHGIVGTTHRRVAEAAEVPLGAMTYYFTGMDDFLQLAFSKLAKTMSEEMESMLKAATTKEQARQATIDLICNGTLTSGRNLALMFELTAYAAREPSLRPLLRQWMGISESYLSQHFGPATAKILDAFIDGVLMRNIVSENHISREEVTEFVLKLTA